MESALFDDIIKRDVAYIETERNVTVSVGMTGGMWGQGDRSKSPSFEAQKVFINNHTSYKDGHMCIKGKKKLNISWHTPNRVNIK